MLWELQSEPTKPPLHPLEMVLILRVQFGIMLFVRSNSCFFTGFRKNKTTWNDNVQTGLRILWLCTGASWSFVHTNKLLSEIFTVLNTDQTPDKAYLHWHATLNELTWLNLIYLSTISRMQKYTSQWQAFVTDFWQISCQWSVSCSCLNDTNAGVYFLLHLSFYTMW